MELKEDQQRRSECAEALLDLLQTTESPEPTQPPSDSPQPEDTSGILNDQQGKLTTSIIIKYYKCDCQKINANFELGLGLENIVLT